MGLAPARIAQVDSTGQTADVLGLPGQVRDALERVESAGVSPARRSGGLVVAGMGGSGIGARLAFGAIGDLATGRLAVASGYALPPGTTDDTLVLCSSYSGETEETLSAYDHARRVGAPTIVSTTGGTLAGRAHADGVPVIDLPEGFQPRHAVGYATVVALEATRLAGAAPDLRGEAREAADGLDLAPEEAPALAERLHDTTPVFYGAELTAALAYRWKCQFNENAKLPAFASELPEADHNEVCGWAASERLTAVFLEDPGMHPRNARRMEITRELTGDAVVVAGSEGPPLARLLRGVLLGDLVSVYAAVLRGTDPVSIEALDQVKARLSDPATG